MLWYYKYYIYMKRYIINQYNDYFNYIRKKLIYSALQWAFNELKVNLLNLFKDLKALKVLETALFKYNDVIDNDTLTIILDKLIYIITAVSIFHYEPDKNICNALLGILTLYEKKKFNSNLMIDIYIIDNTYIYHIVISNVYSSSEYSIRIDYPTLITILNRIKYNKLNIKRVNNSNNIIENHLQCIGTSKNLFKKLII